MKIKLLSLSLLSLALFSSSYAQKVYELTDCIKTGLEKNFSLLVTKNSEVIAKNNYTIGNAGFLPSLSLSRGHSGTLYDIHNNIFDTTHTDTRNIFNTSSSGSLTMDWTIFNGFNVVNTYKKLGELKELGTLNTQMEIENLIADIISGYYNYIQQVQLLNNIKYAVTLSKERLRIDEDRYLLGSSSKLQVLQSRVYLNSDSSRLSQQYEVVRSAEVSLNELMAVDDLSSQWISKDTAIEVDNSLLYEKLLEETLNKNTSIQIASKNKTISEYDHKLVISRSYPYLAASASYNGQFSASSYVSNKNQLSNGLNYGLTFRFNIFNGLTQQRSIRNSSIDVRNKELSYREIEQGVRADLITIYSAYSNYLRLTTLEQQNLQTATENLSIAMERYKLGELSGIDLREVQKSLLDAKESLLSVQYQTKLAEISLLLISGRIMEYYK
jgi:outer membrane protein TolC